MPMSYAHELFPNRVQQSLANPQPATMQKADQEPRLHHMEDQQGLIPIPVCYGPEQEKEIHQSNCVHTT